MKLWQKIIRRRVYADAAAATPLSPRVKREVMRLFSLYGNPNALHQEAQAAKRELDGARKRAAEAIGAHADEIVFTSGGTESNNLAMFGVIRKFLAEKKPVHAVTTTIEHSSVLEPLRALAKEGLELTELPVDREGRIDPKDVREAIKDHTVLASIQMVNSEIGTIQDIREIAKEIRHIKKERKNSVPLYLHTDASQAPLWLKLGVEQLGIDLMTLDAQKMMGPKGAGALFVRRSTALAPLIYGGGQEKGLRSGTENVVFAGALALALEEAQDVAQKRAQEISVVRDFLIQEIQKRIFGSELNGAGGDDRVANNINMYLPHLNGDMAVVALDAKGVAASTRSACDTEDEAPSHVLAALGLPPEKAKNSIRLTLLPGASKADASRIAEALFQVAARYSQK